MINRLLFCYFIAAVHNQGHQAAAQSALSSSQIIMAGAQDDKYYGVSFVYGEWDKKFLFEQTKEFGNRWTIREISKTGTLGIETDRGNWDGFYDVQCVYRTLNGSFYVFGQRK